MEGFRKEFEQSGLATGAKVFHCQTEIHSHIYYFSPEASAVAPELLLGANAASCPEPTTLDGFRQVNL